jgi:hypothetical protein
MGNIRKLLSTGLVALVFVVASAGLSVASQKFTKETGKKCLDCHKKIPKKGDADLQLTELGQKFKENGNKLPK